MTIKLFQESDGNEKKKSIEENEQLQQPQTVKNTKDCTEEHRRIQSSCYVLGYN